MLKWNQSFLRVTGGIVPRNDRLEENITEGQGVKDSQAEGGMKNCSGRNEK